MTPPSLFCHDNCYWVQPSLWELLLVMGMLVSLGVILYYTVMLLVIWDEKRKSRKRNKKTESKNQ